MLEDAYGRYPNSQREGTGSMTGPTVIYRGDTSMLGRRPGLGEILSTVRASSVFTHRPSVSTVFARDTLRSGPRPTVPRPSDPSLRSGSENFTFLGVDSVREGRVRPVGRHVRSFCLVAARVPTMSTVNNHADFKSNTVHVVTIHAERAVSIIISARQIFLFA